MAKYQVLDNFYKDQRWLSFRAGYTTERIARDGGSRCDYCGEWIDRADEVTLHHITELTPDNVHDAMIALNPDNIKQVHAACHNMIHKHGAIKQRRVFIVYGPPMSGKTSYVRQRAWPGDLIVDMDSLYEAISGLERYNKPNTLLPNIMAVQELLLDNIRTRYGRWDNAWIIGGYPERYRRDQLAKELGAALVPIIPTKQECLDRLKSDPARKHRQLEWTGYIEKWFDQHTG